MTACSRLEAKLEARTAQVEALLPLKERMKEVEAGASSTSVPRPRASAHTRTHTHCSKLIVGCTCRQMQAMLPTESAVK